MSTRFKRLRRRETISPRFLTCSCYHRLQLFGRTVLRDLFADSLRAVREESGMSLVAWVLMPEHFHLLLVPGTDWPVPRILVGLKQPFAEAVIARWRALNAPVLPRLLDVRGKTHFWQPGGGFDRNVRNEDELGRKIQYIHANPVRRGLVREPTDWPWSSARWYAGDCEGQIPIDRARF